MACTASRPPATIGAAFTRESQLSNHEISASLVERLIETSFWLRRIPYGICAGLFLWMAAEVVGASGAPRSDRGDR